MSAPDTDGYPFDLDEDDGYDDARCPECGAGGDEQCALDCTSRDDDEDDEAFL